MADFTAWKRGLDSHAEAHREAGLTLEHLWRNVDDPNEVFFVFEVDSMEKAKAFISAPSSAEAEEAFGVLEGDYWFVR